MSQELRLRRGGTVAHSVFTGANGEVTVDTDKKTIVAHDGITPGGYPMASYSEVIEIRRQGAAYWHADLAPYDLNAEVFYNGKRWRSTIANNSAMPESGPEWLDVTPGTAAAANVVQTTGSSTADVMTQNAVTDAILNIIGKTVTGSITLNGTTDNTVVMTDIVTELELEVGDVIRIDTGTYNKLHTVESITNNSSIIVNYEHAGNRANGSLKLPDFTGQATVTRIAKWFNAPVGLGQAWLDVVGSRAEGTTYTNTTGKPIQLQIIFDSKSGDYFIVDGIATNTDDNSDANNTINTVIPAGVTYSLTDWILVKTWLELR